MGKQIDVSFSSWFLGKSMDVNTIFMNYFTLDYGVNDQNTTRSVI